MTNGINTVGASVPVTMTTAKILSASTQAFATADNSFNAGRSTFQTASDAYQATLGPLYTWLLNLSNVLANRFGTRWNTQWAQAGFINNTTAIPNRTPQRITLAQRLVDFLTKNPDYEVPSMGLTAAAGTALVAATQSAQTSLKAAEATQKQLGHAWTTAYETLVANMNELLKNLEAKLKKDDTRWLAFGLQIPATITTPAQPQNVRAHVDPSSGIIVQCDPVRNAARYRFRMMIIGVQTDYALVAGATEPLTAIKKKVLPGQTVQIIVQAVSGHMQSVPSEPVLLTIPLPPLKSASGPADDFTALEQITPSTAVGDGNAKGNRMPALS